jgi:hypothetical protein
MKTHTPLWWRLMLLMVPSEDGHGLSDETPDPADWWKSEGYEKGPTN